MIECFAYIEKHDRHFSRYFKEAIPMSSNTESFFTTEKFEKCTNWLTLFHFEKSWRLWTS